MPTTCINQRTTNNRYWLCSEVTLSVEGGLSVTTGCGLTGDGDNPLEWNPHPTEFVPYSDVKFTGDGDGVGLGYTTFKWTSGNGILTAEMWDYLMSFFTASEPTANVYVRTRTDTIITNALGEYEYNYAWYFAKMHRPKGDPYPPFRFKNVEILFTHAVAV